MSTYETALKYLKKIHNLLQEKNLVAYNLDRDQYLSMDIGQRNKTEKLFKFMEQEGWIKKHTPCVGLPISYILTSLGVKVAEGYIEKQTAISNTFNIGENYGVAAANANDFIINQGISFADIEKLVNEKIADADKRKTIIESLQRLEELIRTGKPIEKGVLSGVSSQIQEHSWLASPIMGMVFQYLIG